MSLSLHSRHSSVETKAALLGDAPRSPDDFLPTNIPRSSRSRRVLLLACAGLGVTSIVALATFALWSSTSSSNGQQPPLIVHPTHEFEYNPEHYLMGPPTDSFRGAHLTLSVELLLTDTQRTCVPSFSTSLLGCPLAGRTMS